MEADCSSRSTWPPTFGATRWLIPLTLQYDMMLDMRRDIGVAISGLASLISASQGALKRDIELDVMNDMLCVICQRQPRYYATTEAAMREAIAVAEGLVDVTEYDSLAGCRQAMEV